MHLQKHQAERSKGDFVEIIFEKIIEIIEDIADIPSDDIKKDSAFIDDLDLSSIELMSIIAEVESLFSIKISESEMLSIKTIQDLADLIEAKQ